MKDSAELEHCLSFINTQLRVHGNGRTIDEDGRVTVVTISRQAGCGALVVAQKLAAYLQANRCPEEPPWTVFDRNLVEYVLEDHHLPRRLARFMPENWTSQISSTIDELFGLHPPSWILVRQTAETILRLAKLGNVILIGRASNILTARLGSVFHVRLVAPLEKRLERIQDTEHLDRKRALEFIRREDRGRKQYLQRYYHQSIDNPLLYHLIINTELICCERAARMIGDFILESRAEMKPAAV